MSPPRTGRVDRGRGHSYWLDGEHVPGATTIISKGVPKHLEEWVARTTAGYACDHWAELAEVGTAERMQRLTRARWETSNAAAVRGTAIHDWAHRYAAAAEDTELEVPEALAGHVDAYLQFTREWRVAEELAEVVVISREWRYMGTLDLIATLADGRRWLLDYKTGTSGIYPETALQLAAYAHAETYLDGEGIEREMPEIDAAGAVWLRADGYELIPCEIGERTFRTFLHAAVVARFTDEPRETYIGDALRPPRHLEAVEQ